jgi:enamine deaminase RidA (YjgF/YER057c/UK114 family)
MGAHEERLQELGIDLPAAAEPTGLYTPVVVHDDLAFVSGHAADDGGEWIRGVIGADLDLEQAKAAARAATLACLSSLRHELGGLDRIARVLKVTGMLCATADFGEHPRVMDAATQLLLDVFGDDGHHARTSVGMASLPFGTAIEIDMVVALARTGER